MRAMEALGSIFGPPVMAASGVYINMRDYRAITFLTYEEDGSTIITLNEATDAAGTGAQNLAVIDRPYKLPGTGGAATLDAQTAAATYDLGDDTTNDATVVTIYADEMSDGFDFIGATVDGGICVAIPHSPLVKRAGDKMPSPIA